jgi:alpha-amylase
VEKWKSEGRYEEELAELDDFFAETGYPKAPRFYIMKWLSDYITDYGIDGYRVDTVKHVEESVWSEFKEICDRSFDLWKKSNPEQASNSNFYLIGEVYNYIFYNAKNFDFGDRKVDYFDQRFDALINFEFKYNAEDGYEKTFSRYSDQLNGEMSGYSVMNYLDSHDDGSPFDPDRTRGLEAGTKLLLSPGISQVYYGDESNRDFSIEGAQGDANLRSNMNWEDLENSDSVIDNFSHWSKLGKFRRNHMSVGAGLHKMLQESPYVFSRTYTSDSFEDRVVVGLDFDAGSKLIEVKEVFEDGAILRDAYSDQTIEVIQGKVEFDSPYSVILLEKI